MRYFLGEEPIAYCKLCRKNEHGVATELFHKFENLRNAILRKVIYFYTYKKSIQEYSS